MASPTLHYRFVLNTNALAPQIDINWLPFREREHGNMALKAIAPTFKVRGATWPPKLQDLRAQAKAQGKIVKSGGHYRLWGTEAWLFDALEAEAGFAAHPGSSRLDIEVEAMKGTRLPPKKDPRGSLWLVATLLHDFAPTSPLGQLLSKPLKIRDTSSDIISRAFIAVVRTGVAKKGVWSVLAPTQLLAPFAAGKEKDCDVI